MRQYTVFYIITVYTLIGCIESPQAPNSTIDIEVGTGAGTDVATEAGVTAGIESGTEAGVTAGTEAGITAGTEAGVTAGTEAGVTAGSESGTEAGVIAGNGSGTEAGSDSGTEAGEEAGTSVVIEYLCPNPIIQNPVRLALAGDVIELDASLSTNFDHTMNNLVSYEWIVISRPEGSTSQIVERFNNPINPLEGGIADDTSTPKAQFLVDVNGEYQIQLMLTNQQGFITPSEECPQDDTTISISSNNYPGISVELYWDTPSDPDQTDDIGTDMDLHFLHPNAMGNQWNSEWDCNYANPAPSWDMDGRGAILEIDDVNGAGPEIISYQNPDFTNLTSVLGPYVVGVEYYRASFNPVDRDDRVSEATIKVSIAGLLVSEINQTLTSSGQFWKSLAITYTENEKSVLPIGRVYDTLNEAE